jgi:hypothetical protein
MNNDEVGPVNGEDEDCVELSEQANDRRSKNVGVGVGFLVAGIIVVANELGWTNIGWFLPAILIGYGAYYLILAFES